MFTALARRGYREGGEGAGGGNAQSQLVMTELRRAAFFEESHVCVPRGYFLSTYLPISDFIPQHDDSLARTSYKMNELLNRD